MKQTWVKDSCKANPSIVDIIQIICTVKTKISGPRMVSPKMIAASAYT